MNAIPPYLSFSCYGTSNEDTHWSSSPSPWVPPQLKQFVVSFSSTQSSALSFAVLSSACFCASLTLSLFFPFMPLSLLYSCLLHASSAIQSLCRLSKLRLQCAPLILCFDVVVFLVIAIFFTKKSLSSVLSGVSTWANGVLLQVPWLLSWERGSDGTSLAAGMLCASREWSPCMHLHESLLYMIWFTDIELVHNWCKCRKDILCNINASCGCLVFF